MTRSQMAGSGGGDRGGSGVALEAAGRGRWRRRVLPLLLCMVAGQAVAFLPPDADAWAPRRIEERRRDEQAYEQRREELHREATLAREQVRRDIVTPPWMRTDPAAPRAMDAAGRPLPAPVEVRGDRGQKNSRLLVSILLLSLIGGVCGGVAWVTRER